MPGHNGTGAAAVHGAGAYLTNEVFLYRVVRVAASGTGEIVDLEDCYLLDVVRVPARELRERRLRVVTPDPALDDRIHGLN